MQRSEVHSIGIAFIPSKAVELMETHRLDPKPQAALVPGGSTLLDALVARSQRAGRGAGAVQWTWL